MGLYLERSQSKDLHVYFHLEAPLPDCEEAWAALRLLLKTSCQWKSAFLETDLAVWPSIFALCSCSPRLTYLKLQLWDIDGYNAALQEADIPLLQGLRCIFDPADCQLSHFYITYRTTNDQVDLSTLFPFHSIHELMMNGVQYIAPILAQCDRLHTLALVDQVEPAAFGTILSLPYLHTLDVSRICGHQSMEIFKQIKAPSLTFVRIGHDNLDVMPRMLGNFWDTITALSIHLPCCPPTPYLEQLPFLSSIWAAATQVKVLELVWHQPEASIDLWNYHTFSQLLDSLVYSTYKFLPRLHSLTFSCYFHRYTSTYSDKFCHIVPSLLSMVSSRQIASSTNSLNCCILEHLYWSSNVFLNVPQEVLTNWEQAGTVLHIQNVPSVDLPRCVCT
jgi:hypothetical protein